MQYDIPLRLAQIRIESSGIGQSPSRMLCAVATVQGVLVVPIIQIKIVQQCPSDHLSHVHVGAIPLAMTVTHSRDLDRMIVNVSLDVVPVIFHADKLIRFDNVADELVKFPFILVFHPMPRLFCFLPHFTTTPFVNRFDFVKQI